MCGEQLFLAIQFSREEFYVEDFHQGNNHRGMSRVKGNQQRVADHRNHWWLKEKTVMTSNIPQYCVLHKHTFKITTGLLNFIGRTEHEPWTMTCSDPKPDLPHSPDEMKCPEVIGITVLSLWEGYTDIFPSWHEHTFSERCPLLATKNVSRECLRVLMMHHEVYVYECESVFAKVQGCHTAICQGVKHEMPVKL